MTVCKICRLSIFAKQPTEWVSGQAPGLVHTACVSERRLDTGRC